MTTDTLQQRLRAMSPERRQYALISLPAYLAKAGQAERLRSILTDLYYLEAKIALAGPEPVIGDYDLAITLSPSNTLELVQGALRLSAHVLRNDVRQLAGQLLGRLQSYNDPDLQPLLSQARRWDGATWLRPLAPSLISPGAPLVRTLVGHTDVIRGVAVTPDGYHAVSASADHTLRIWDIVTGETVMILSGHTGKVNAVVVTPDGHYAVSASSDTTLKIWDLRNGSEYRTLRGHTDEVYSVAALPDGRHVVSGPGTASRPVDTAIRVWDISTGETVGILHGHTERVNTLLALHDGRRIISASEDETLRVWNIQTKVEERILQSRAMRHVRAMALVRGDAYVLCASDDRALRVWDITTGMEVFTLSGSVAYPCSAVAVLHDGQHAIAAHADGYLVLWDLEEGVEQQTIPAHTSDISTMALTPDGRFLLTAADDATLKVWDIERLKRPAAPWGHQSQVNALAITPDGKRVFSGAGYRYGSFDDFDIKIWDIVSGDEIGILRGHTDEVRAIAVTPDGRRAISVSFDRTLRIWDLEDANELNSISGVDAPAIITPDGAYAITTSFRKAATPTPDTDLYVWHIDSGAQSHRLHGHTEAVNALVVTPDSRLAVSASNDATLRIWELEHGRELSVLTGHTGPVLTVALTPDSRYVISGSADGTLKVWDIKQGAEVHTLLGHTDSVCCVVVMPDGRQVISAAADATLQVWNLVTGRSTHTLRGHGGAINALVLLAGGRWVASASEDMTIKLWEINQGQLVASFNAESPPLVCVAAPDGTTIVAGELSGRMHFLRVEEVSQGVVFGNDATLPVLAGIQIELDMSSLESCRDIVAISHAHQKLAASELTGASSTLLRSFRLISADVDAALSQESTYNKRLALSTVEERLNSLVRELDNKHEAYAKRFGFLAGSWREIIAFYGQELADAARLRQEIDSPYIIGLPLVDRQEIFVGRTDVSVQIEQLLLDRRRPPLLLYGQRRMGKTSLLNNLGRILPTTIVPLFVDLQGAPSRASDHIGLLYNIARSMKISAYQKRNLILPQLTREELATDSFTRFDEWLDEVEQALGNDTALLILDEIGSLYSVLSKGRFDEEDVLGMLRNIIQHRGRFKVMLAGSQTLEELQRWSSYLINVQIIHITYLKENEARKLVEQPVKDFVLHYDKDASDYVLRLTRCHPFLVQLLCAEIVALKNEQDPAIRSYAKLADINAALPKALRSGHMFFADIAESQVNAEGVRLLRAIASQGLSAEVRRTDLEQWFPDNSLLQATIDLLLQRELIEETTSGYHFQVEMIRQWFAT